jgi:hypothetical protein
MPRPTILVLLVCMCATGLTAQDLEDLQIHGFATQGFIFSSNNNYLTMQSSRGSLQWTEGAISVTDPVTDNLRVGIQLHMFQMGQFGGPNVLVDWASGDYKVNDHLGFRAGKIKVPLGLFNDSQDVDSLFLWILLPQTVYPIDNRDFNLAMLGGEVYGSMGLGERGGRVEYAAYKGESTLDANGGYVRQLAQAGMTFPSPPSGATFGGDLHWATPWRGFTVGSSANDYALDGTGPQGTFHLPPALLLAYYARWDKGKLHLAAEYWRTPFNFVVTMGGATIPFPEDARSWYPMASYSVTRKLQVGGYYSYYLDKVGNNSLPANYSKDKVVSARYNFNEYFYGKLEGHFLKGTGLGYYTSVNPNGLKPNSNMLLARIGFTF